MRFVPFELSVCVVSVCLQHRKCKKKTERRSFFLLPSSPRSPLTHLTPTRHPHSHTHHTMVNPKEYDSMTEEERTAHDAAARKKEAEEQASTGFIHPLLSLFFFFIC